MKTESNPVPPSPLYLQWLEFAKVAKKEIAKSGGGRFARWVTKYDDDGFTRAKFKNRPVQ
jgi:hypothetical protein